MRRGVSNGTLKKKEEVELMKCAACAWRGTKAQRLSPVGIPIVGFVLENCGCREACALFVIAPLMTFSIFSKMAFRHEFFFSF